MQGTGTSRISRSNKKLFLKTMGYIKLVIKNQK